MTIFDILKLLFTKIADSLTINSLLDSIIKIPKRLKIILGLTILTGLLYFGYSKLNAYEVDTLKSEVADLKTEISITIPKEHANDTYYLIKVIELREAFSMYILEEQQVQIDIIESYIKRHSPNDPVLVDLDAMRQRNKRNYDFYHNEVFRILNNIKQYEKENKTQSQDSKDK